MEEVKILAIESSCDDTSVAIIDGNYHVIENLISSQMEHAVYGGVVPELASRLHMKNIMYLTQAVLDRTGITPESLSAIAVSINPGLIGSLLVGLSFAKSYAYSLGKPLITVNHMLGHVYAAKLENKNLETPYLALIVSGGHTELVYFRSETEFEIVGKTRDDAAGEAFDKAAKLMGLGYPGGPVIDKLAVNGDPQFVRFPRGLNKKDEYSFSFSGLKTSIMNYIAQHDQDYREQHKADIAASFQMAIVDVLVGKTIRYARLHGIERIVVVGGVSANSCLRAEMQKRASKLKIQVIFPPFRYCMDNAAMIAAAALGKWERGEISGWDVNAFSTKGVRYL